LPQSFFFKHALTMTHWCLFCSLATHAPWHPSPSCR
jgi:hypothetical protein